MPNVPLERDMLFHSFGRTFTDKEFDELCFEFGIELDEIVTETRMKRKQEGSEEREVVVYKIDVPANRQDLLCLEGISRALRIFMGKEDVPVVLLASLVSFRCTEWSSPSRSASRCTSARKRR